MSIMHHGVISLILQVVVGCTLSLLQHSKSVDHAADLCQQPRTVVLLPTDNTNDHVTTAQQVRRVLHNTINR